MIWQVTLAIVASAITIANGYSMGAPAEACGDMIPQHHNAPQTTPFPYVVQVEKREMRAGEKVKVVISATDVAKTFKGFFVQARVGNIPVGKFDATHDVQTVDCGDSKASGATHFSGNDRDHVILTWTAPPGLTETVRFRVTVVQDGKTFWVGHLTAPVVVKAN